ncbi:MAG: hypothetical protein HYY18_07755 [Planctomycetes bacterium]|nr:hypothetical protein [Planctomycetota bacterium]
MRCDEAKARLAFLGSGLDAALEAEVRGHLASCPECAAAASEQARVEGLLGRWEPEAPRDLWPGVRARLPGKSAVAWRFGAAAAALLAVAGAFHAFPGAKPAPVRPDERPAIRPSLAAIPSFLPVDDARLALHVALARWNPGELPRSAFLYRGAYDEALAGGTYAEWAEGISAAVPPPPPAVTHRGALIEVPGYLPKGTSMRSCVIGDDGVVEAAFWTPLGEMTISEGALPRGRAGLQTVVRDGREFKLSRFVVRGVEITVVTQTLPWPEMERIRQGFIGR